MPTNIWVEQLKELENQRDSMQQQMDVLRTQMNTNGKEARIYKTEAIMSSGMLLEGTWLFETLTDDGVLVLCDRSDDLWVEDEQEDEQDDEQDDEQEVESFAQLRKFIEDEDWYHFSFPLDLGDDDENPKVELRVDDDELRISIRKDVLGFIERTHLKVDFTPLIKKETMLKNRLSEVRKIMKAVGVKSKK